MIQIAKFVLGGLMILGLPSVARATLIGDTINIDWFYPDASTSYVSAVHVISGGIEVDCPNGSGSGGNSTLCAGFAQGARTSIDIGAETISFVAAPIDFNAAAFNGFVFSDLDWLGVAGKIIDVALETNMELLDLSRVTHTAHSVSINLQDTGNFSVDDDQYFTLTLAVAHVPEPGTLALLSLGLAGLGFCRRKASTKRLS